ncbi:MAG: YegS/Rv2252/BmrU family lipid kinase [Actinobacteria bacterium]|nr:YegS/Rv2252/BmrU family lipid kinase [Actinomycetota bacterium]
MPREVDLLVNPTAGRGRARHLVEPVTARLRELGCAVRVLTAESPKHADRLASEAVDRRTEVLAVLGGDGTCHLALQHLAGSPSMLGVIPAGTGNDLQASVGGPADPLRAAETVAIGEPRIIDLGRTADTWWATVLCAGFDSRINERANRLRWPRGRRRYDLAILIELARLRALPATVTVDGHRWRGPVTMVSVGNGPSYGGGQLICPDARPDDGLLDVAVVQPLSRLDVARLKPKLATGELGDHPAVLRWRAREVRLEVAGTIAYADGERVGPLPLSITNVPGALRVLAPLPSRPCPDPVGT